MPATTASYSALCAFACSGADSSSAIGCPIHHSAIYKIEKGDPPRKITVTELVGFAAVFNLSVEELLTPAEVTLDRDTVDAFNRWADSNAKFGQASTRLDEAIERLRELLAGQDGVIRTAVERAMRTYIASTYPTSDPDKALTYLSLTLAGVPLDDQRWHDYDREYGATNGKH